MHKIKTAFLFLVALVVLLLAMPRSTKFSCDYKKGSPWKYETLISNFDFPIIKTAEQIQQERADNVESKIPYYKYSQDIVNKSLRSARSLELGELSQIRPALISSLTSLYENGVLSDEGIKKERDGDSNPEGLLYIQKDKRAVKYPASEIYKLSDARHRILSDLLTVYPMQNLDSLLIATGAYNLVVPNLIYDAQTTQLVQSEADWDVSPTLGYMKAGQLIVSEGEIVTAEIAQILDSYKLEYDSSVGYSRNIFFFWAGNLLVALAMVLLLFLSVLFCCPDVLVDFRRMSYIVMVFCLTAVAALLVPKIGEHYLYLFPFVLTPLLMKAFFQDDISFAVTTVSLLPLLVFSHSGLVLYTVFLAGGAVAIALYRFMDHNWKIFLLSLASFLAMALVYSGFRLLDFAQGNSFLTLVFLLVSAIIAAFGSMLTFVFERLFGLLSNSRLVELSDTSNSLLRALEQKAPGTFQHSLQVANMADAAARSIGANPMLLRAGALYHDIGKMNNPQCFVENESLLSGEGISKYHDGLSPVQSARDIIRHATEGIEMADKEHLPSQVRDFILTHHGTSCVSFFYNKYLKSGGDPAEENMFHYEGEKPKTREQVILMLCDSIEAASRTLKEHDPKAYDTFVEQIVRGKIDEGQLEEAEISIKELGTVKEVIKGYLAQIYHERIVYPKRK